MNAHHRSQPRQQIAQPALPFVPFGAHPALRDGLGRDPLRGVLVKFTFTNPKMVPDGIARMDQYPNYFADLDRNRSLAALDDGDVKGAEVGRIRAGHTDTGDQAIAIHDGKVHAGLIRRGLAHKGFRLVGLHCVERLPSDDPKDTRKPMQIVFAGFSTGGTPLQMESWTEKALRELANGTWKRCYVWDNPNGTCTINFLSRLPEVKPEKAIAIRDDAIRAVDIPAAMTEEQE